MAKCVNNIGFKQITPNNSFKRPESQISVPQEEKDSKKETKLLLALSGLAVLGGTIAALKYKKKPPLPDIPKPKTPLTNKDLIKKYNLDEEFYSTRPMTMYRDIVMDIFYPQIRKTTKPYTTRSSCYSKIGDITSKTTKDVNVTVQNGWHYRIPKKQDKAPIVDRISLNVYPEADLIKKLDEIVAKSKGEIEYKTPTGLKGWNDRHDPITIYFRRPVNKADETAIVNIAQPHIRPTKEEVLIGRKITDSIYEVPEPTEKDVLELIERAKKLGNDDLVKVIEDPSG